MATKKAPPIGGTTAGVNPSSGKTQTVFAQGEPSGDNREAGTRATQPSQFSQHPGHGSAKRTMAGEKNG